MVLHLVVAEGPGFGTGHVARMDVLARLLARRGTATQRIPLTLAPAAATHATATPATATHATASHAAASHAAASHATAAHATASPNIVSSPLAITPDFPWPADSDALFVLDARDLDPRPFLARGRVIALDNRHPARERLIAHDYRHPARERLIAHDCPDSAQRTESAPVASARIRFHDAIPHPDADLDVVLRNCLIAPEYLSPALPRPDRRRALTYAGALDDIDLSFLDAPLAALVNSGELDEVLRVGGPPPEEGLARYVRHAARLDATEFRVQLAGSGYVFSYFGVTLLEAWFRGCICALYSFGSPVHDSLSDYLARRTGMTFLKPASESFPPLDTLGRLPGPRPGGDGYPILIDLIDEMARASSPAHQRPGYFSSA